LWFSFHRREVRPPMQARDSQTEKNVKTPPPQVGDDRPAPQSVATVVKSPNVPSRRRESPRSLLAQNQRRATQIRPPALTAEELAEKEQVLVALRLVSAKLNLAQRKTQGGPQLNSIRNQ